MKTLIVYKLTDKNHRTCNDCQWGKNIEHRTSGKGDLCTEGWLHWYADPYLAVLFNPIHAEFANPVLWRAVASGRMKHDRGLKSGSSRLKTLKIIPLPEIPLNARVRFAIKCALLVYSNPQFVEWAKKWLNGSNRTTGAAYAAAKVAAAKVAAATVAAYAANAAAYAANAAAAYAAYAAYAAAYADAPINFAKLIRQCIREEKKLDLPRK